MSNRIAALVAIAALLLGGALIASSTAQLGERMRSQQVEATSPR